MQELLDRIGWSKQYFADHLGVSLKTIYNWCNGNPNPIAMKYLQLVCRMVGV